MTQPAIIDHAPAALPRPAPELGEHTLELLTELGYPAGAIAELAGRGVTSAPQAKNHISSAIYAEG